jgi:hypothetical protein
LNCWSTDSGTASCGATGPNARYCNPSDFSVPNCPSLTRSSESIAENLRILNRGRNRRVQSPTPYPRLCPDCPCINDLIGVHDLLSSVSKCQRWLLAIIHDREAPQTGVRTTTRAA